MCTSILSRHTEDVMAFPRVLFTLCAVSAFLQASPLAVSLCLKGYIITSR